MSHQPLAGSFISARVRGALVALAALTVSVPSVWADAQSEISAHLPTGKTILTAKAADLETAVDLAITSSTDFTPAQLAAAALAPIPESSTGKVRSDRNTTAGLIAEGIIATINSGGKVFVGGTSVALAVTNPAYASTIGSVVNSLVAVNGTFGNTKLTLTTAGQGTTIKDALGTISDAIATTGTSTLAADFAIGASLNGDAYLQSLVKGALLTSLQTGIAGINGVKGKSTADAQFAAAEFVSGVLSTGTIPTATGPAVPGAAIDTTFGIAILKGVSKNASVDEFVANAIGAHLSTTADLTTLALGLSQKYTTAATVAKIVQGVAADAVANSTESNRAAFITSLTTSLSKDAVAIAQGGAYVDPFYSGTFTAATFSGLISASGNNNKLAVKYAAGIATGVGNILGHDGDVLTNVAAVYGALTGSNTLSPATAATYANDLISGAVKSKIPTSAFTGAATGAGGGQLGAGVLVGAGGTGKNTGATVTVGVSQDLSSILNLFAEGIIAGSNLSSVSTTKDVANVAKYIGTLAEDVVKYVKNANTNIPNPTTNATQPAAAYLAGTLANVIDSLLGNLAQPTTTVKGVAETPEQVIFAALIKDVQAVTQSTASDNVDAAVAAAVNGFASYAANAAVTKGALTNPETPVTNL